MESEQLLSLAPLIGRDDFHVGSFTSLRSGCHLTGDCSGCVTAMGNHTVKTAPML
jgi:hypothetical protein